MEFDILWILNGISKSPSKTVFLFVKHFSEFVLIYLFIKPKGVDRKLMFFFLCVTFLDIFHFILLSGFGFGEIKLLISVLLFLFIRSKYFKWGS